MNRLTDDPRWLPAMSERVREWCSAIVITRV